MFHNAFSKNAVAKNFPSGGKENELAEGIFLTSFLFYHKEKF